VRDEEEIAEAESVLRAAMLASDAAALDILLDDAVCFTDQFGNRLSKSDDLAAHRSGLLQVKSIDPLGDAAIALWGDTATVSVVVDLAGLYDDTAFFGRFAYSRVWHRQEGRWRVVLAHCSAVPATG